MQLQVRIPFVRPGRSRQSSSVQSTASSYPSSSASINPSSGSSRVHSSQARQSGNQGEYLLTYLDDDMLIGRQQAGAGTFIFERTSRDSTPWVWR